MTAAGEVRDRMTPAIEKLKANRGAVAGAIGLGVAAAATYYVIKRRSRSIVPKSGPFPAETLPEGAYDAVIVGSGPSGSTCAYYLAKAGARVALLDKETFPRDKYCGDAVKLPLSAVLAMQNGHANNCWRH
jgi:NADPH-dependent 2,4-dienoyl-CoA reductase/sulfur reductase-like enzyme